MTPRVLAALAVADFRERTRRPAYALTLLAAVGLAFLAAPSDGTRWVIVNLGDHRGVYDSAYLGAVTALAGALWLCVGGFYVVRVAVGRDRVTGVGQVLATTPLRTVGYLLGKFLSNLLVLASMAGVLAGTALVVQFARGESNHVDPIALLLPFGLFTLPVLAVTAACAVLFETVPWLRAGLGNIVWFGAALFVVIAAQSPTAPLGGLGVPLFAESVRADLAARDIAIDEFGLGLMYLDSPLRTFEWSGLDVTAGFVAARLALFVVAAGVAVLPVLWFGRFDPARGRATVPAPPRPTAPYPAGSPTATATFVRPRTAIRSGNAFGRMLVGELRILVRGVSPWWWLGVAALATAGLLIPGDAVVGPLLLATCVWPILIWSRLGTQHQEHGVDTLTGAYPARRRRLLAEWTAGVVLTALVGLAPAVRMVLATDWAAVAAWGAGTLLVPSLALGLGVLSRTHRLFQVVYLPLWYGVANDIAALDFIGAVRVDGRPVGPHPLAVLGIAAVMVGSAFVVASVRHRRR